MCGRRFKKIGNQIYCNSCDNSYEKIDKKTTVCIDCGEEFEVDAKDNETCRCRQCYKEYRKECVKENVRRYRENKKKCNM